MKNKILLIFLLLAVGVAAAHYSTAEELNDLEANENFATAVGEPLGTVFTLVMIFGLGVVFIFLSVALVATAIIMKRTIKNKRTKAFGTASLILGIVSVVLFIMPYITLPTTVGAIYFSRLQKKRSGMATAGLVLGIIGAVFNIFGWVLLVAGLMG